MALIIDRFPVPHYRGGMNLETPGMLADDWHYYPMSPAVMGIYTQLIGVG
jgi:hypothetical protein